MPKRKTKRHRELLLLPFALFRETSLRLLMSEDIGEPSRMKVLYLSCLFARGYT